MSSITGITHRPRTLGQPAGQPEGARWYYGLAIPMQVSSTKAALLVNIRDVGSRGADHVDFEQGSDAIVFDRVDAIDPARAVSLSRNHEEQHPRARETCIMVKHPVISGFVPLGAKREDGSEHPHAGTGFGLSAAVAWPMRGTLLPGYQNHRPYGGEHEHGYTELFELRFDGETLHVDGVRRVADEAAWLGGYRLGFVGLTPPTPDGDDLLFPMRGCRANGEHMELGIARWRREGGAWRVSEWHEVADEEHEHFEMSVVRDRDGSLLYTARGNTALVCHNFRVWRSTDNGRTWRDHLKVQWVRSAAPVTINRAADGTPFLLANLYETPLCGTADPLLTPRSPSGWVSIGGYRRDKLYAWALSEDRENLEAPVLMRDCPADFGEPPGGSTWSADHPMAQPLRLADERWHTVITYRTLERGENGLGCAPTEYTGCFVEEVQCAGEPVPLWRF